MNVLLIRPPDFSLGKFKEVGGVQHPINLVYLATSLIKNGHDAEILDLEVEPMDKEELSRYFNKFEFDVVGITVVTPAMPTTVEITELAKNSGAVVVLGGPHPTVLSEQTLEETDADIIVRGEGEITLVKVLEALEKGKSLENVRGISYKENERIIHNEPCSFIENLDDLPLPDRTLLKLDDYKGESTPGITKSSTVVFTSRGCPFNCNFCASRVIHSRKCRFRSVENLLEEIRQIEKLGFSHATIDDDTFTVNKKRAIEFCERVAEEFQNMTFDCDSRVDGIDRELLTAMKKAGFLKIAYGVESGSERILKYIRKNVTIDQMINAFKLTKELGIETQAFISVGHFPETKKDIEMTRNLIKKLNPDYLVVSIIIPYPGTELYDYAIEKRYLKKSNWGDFAYFKKKIAWRTDNFTAEELVEIRDKLYRGFYMNPRYILKRLTKLRNLNQLKYSVKSGVAMLKYIDE